MTTEITAFHEDKINTITDNHLPKPGTCLSKTNRSTIILTMTADITTAWPVHLEPVHQALDSALPAAGRIMSKVERTATQKNIAAHMRALYSAHNAKVESDMRAAQLQRQTAENPVVELMPAQRLVTPRKSSKVGVIVSVIVAAVAAIVYSIVSR